MVDGNLLSSGSLLYLVYRDLMWFCTTPGFNFKVGGPSFYCGFWSILSPLPSTTSMRTRMLSSASRTKLRRTGRQFLDINPVVSSIELPDGDYDVSFEIFGHSNSNLYRINKKRIRDQNLGLLTSR